MEDIIMFTKRKIIMLLIVAALGIISGRLSLRAVGNMLLGGTLFGGNIL